MGTEMHVWVGDEDPLELPFGGVTLFIHQGKPPGPAGSSGNAGVSPGKADPHGDVGTPVTLKDPTPGGGVYANLIRGVDETSRLDWIGSVLGGRVGREVGIELPDLVVDGSGGREAVFEPLLDGLRDRSIGDIKVHLIRTSDLPPVDD